MPTRKIGESPWIDYGPTGVILNVSHRTRPFGRTFQRARPHTGKDFVSTRALRNVQISGGDVAFDVELGYPAKSLVPELRRSLVAAAKGVAGVSNVSVNITTKVIAHAVQRVCSCCPGEEHHCRGDSGKAGVGKSTTAANRPGPGRRGRQRGRARRRHLRPQPAHDAGHQPPPWPTTARPWSRWRNYGVQVMSIGFWWTRTKP